MLSEREVLGLQAEKHELITPDSIANPEEYNLFLIHRKAYDLAARLSRGSRVLDFGCNTGYGTALIEREAASATGADVSPAAIEEGRRRYPHIDLRLVDGRSLPFEDAAFDLVVSFQVIEHVADTERFLAEIKRVVSPSGIFLLTTPNAALRLAPGMKPWNPFHVREYRADELHELLAREFGDVHVRGLFADEPLQRIEVQRVTRLLEKSRRRQSKWYRLKRVFEPRRHKAVPDVALSDLRRYSSTAFRYRREDLDRALDLLALCRSKF